MNKFQFLGRLTKDVEVKTTANGNSTISTFTLAVNRKFADQNGERQTDFFNVTSFGKTAEFVSKYFSKGLQVLVEGRIQNRSWEDQNGQKRFATDFIAEDVYFADSRKQNDGPQNDTNGEMITISDEEDLPF